MLSAVVYQYTARQDNVEPVPRPTTAPSGMRRTASIPSSNHRNLPPPVRLATLAPHPSDSVHHLVEQDHVVLRLEHLEVLVVAARGHRRVAVDAGPHLLLRLLPRRRVGRQARHPAVGRVGHQRRLTGLADLVAGVEPALMVEAAGGPAHLTPAALRTALTGSALDILAPGVDAASGAGIATAPGAVRVVARCRIRSSWMGFATSRRKTAMLCSQRAGVFQALCACPS